MNKEENITNRLLLALTSNEKDFSKILLEETTVAGCERYEIPIEKAFVEHFTSSNDKEGLRAIALIATLYLSVTHCQFPTATLRASVNYLRDNITLPTFNCNHYENIYAKLSNEDSVELTLLNRINRFTKISLTKHQIFDALDFLSNGL